MIRRDHSTHPADASVRPTRPPYERIPMKIGRITASDRASAGIYADLSGPAIEESLRPLVADGPMGEVVAHAVPKGDREENHGEEHPALQQAADRAVEPLGEVEVVQEEEADADSGQQAEGASKRRFRFRPEPFAQEPFPVLEDSDDGGPG